MIGNFETLAAERQEWFRSHNLVAPYLRRRDEPARRGTAPHNRAVPPPFDYGRLFTHASQKPAISLRGLTRHRLEGWPPRPPCHRPAPAQHPG